jgi:putative ABC transport system permease protein
MNPPTSRFYRSLLRLLPPAFRHRHGAEMEAVFLEMRDEARGPIGRAGVYGRAVWDVARQGSQERSRERAARAHETRTTRGWTVDEIIQDLRYSIRQLRRRPGFTLVLVMTLALGIGANTAVFSVVQGVLLRPLPYDNPEELAVIWTQFPTMDLMEFQASPPEFWDYQEQNRSFAAVGGMARREQTITGEDNPERVPVAFFTWEMFEVLGVEAAQGRVFNEVEDQGDAAPTVVLSDGVWRRRYGSDPGIVGQSIQINGDATLVLGVMPADFAFPDPAVELWLPMQIDRANPPHRANHFLNLVGRLAPGVTMDAAQDEIASIVARWGEDEAIGHTWRPEGHPAFIRPLHTQLVGDVRTPLLVLLGAVGFVLLIACSNVANLLLVRGEGRQREISIRAAMGAGRGRIVKLLVTESTVMAVLGGAAGVGLAVLGLEALVALAPDTLPRVAEIGVDRGVLLFSGGVTVLSGLLFGLAPALQATSLNIQGTLRDEGRSGTVSKSRFRLRQLLVVSEMAMAVVLLISAGLLMQSFWRLNAVDPGFRTEGVLRMAIDVPQTTYPEAEDVLGFYNELQDRLRGLPGVQAVSAVRTAPLSGSLPPNDIEIENYEPPGDDGAPLNADIQIVEQDYFQAMGIDLVEGRTFDHGDHTEAEVVAVIDEVLAGRFFPEGVSPVGWRIRQPGSEWARIIGVTGSVLQEGLDRDARASLYLVHDQAPLTWRFERNLTLVMRAGVDPMALVGPARAEIRAMHSDVPVYRISTMEQTVAESTATERFSMFLHLVFGGVALTLAVVGIYGVLSYSVAQRTQEIGIRMALGAGRGEILKLVVGQGMTLVVVSVGIGLVGALLAGQVISSLLFGISARDPLTFAAVSGLLGATALLACWIPARRASSVSPQTALRQD